MSSYRFSSTTNSPTMDGVARPRCCALVDEIKGGAVCLSKGADETRRTWQ